jgi:hypothetical protein
MLAYLVPFVKRQRVRFGPSRSTCAAAGHAERDPELRAARRHPDELLNIDKDDSELGQRMM